VICSVFVEYVFKERRKKRESQVEVLFFSQKFVLNWAGNSGVSDSPLSFIAFPNPFQNDLNLNIYLPKQVRTTMEVFDLQGRRVDVVNYGNLDSGYHQLNWEGREKDGQALSSGIYFIRLVAGEEVMTQKVFKQ
jgi:hypothetical protein